MPNLTIDLIRENPWNVVTHTLPPRASAVLFALALLAADYCRRSEQFLMFAARAGDYIPTGYDPDSNEIQPDIHEESEQRSVEADCALLEIHRRYETER